MTEKTTNDLIITVRLPEEEAAGIVTISRKDLAVIHQFNYQATDEIWEAVKLAAGRLMAVEENPPPLDIPKAGAKALEKIAEKPAPEDAMEEDIEESDDARWMLDACEILLSFMEAIRQAQAMSILIRLGKANAKTEHLPVLEEGGVS